MKDNRFQGINKHTYSIKVALQNNKKVYIPSYTIDGEKWEFNKGDKDPFPSVPHGHSKENRQKKLDVAKGIIYYNGKIIKRLRKDELNKLKNDKAFIKLAEELIKWHMENNPIKNFDYPKWIELNLEEPEEKKKE